MFIKECTILMLYCTKKGIKRPVIVFSNNWSISFFIENALFVLNYQVGFQYPNSLIAFVRTYILIRPFLLNVHVVY